MVTFTKFHLFLHLLLSTHLVAIINCSPPPEPIECSSPTECTLTNTFGAFSDRSVCKVGRVAYPMSEEELISLVATATKKRRKMKVATRYSHTATRLACPGGDDGLLISTQNLNRILKIDKEGMTITVESGVLLKDIAGEAAKEGLALPNFPYYWGMTIGGVITTGSHGSSFWGKGGAVHDYVIALTIVSPGKPQEGSAVIRDLDEIEFADELNAAKLSIGVLGVIYKVTLKLEPLFKKKISFDSKSDEDLAEEVIGFGKKFEFGDINWYPFRGAAVYRMDRRCDVDVPGDGVCDYIPFRPVESKAMASRRAIADKEVDRRCDLAKQVFDVFPTMAYGFTNDGSNFTGYPIIGYQNKLQSSGSCYESPEDDLNTTCAWDPRINEAFFYETSFSIALPNARNFINDIFKLVKLNQKAVCIIDQHNGILIRYLNKSTAYLGKPEESLAFDFSYYRSRDPMAPRLFEDVMEEIEQIGIMKYGGLPHWGKNRVLAFDGVMEKYKENGGKFLEVKNEYDPLGLFSSEWSDQLLGLGHGGVAIYKEGCALDGLCVCKEDIHCAPSQGYFCKPGKIFEDARVCTYVS
ncbi:Probable L-gulonolactone oxidase 6 [Linum grandiflorum]